MNPFNQTQPLPFPSHGQTQPFLAPPPPPPFHPIYNPLPFDPSLSLPSSSPHPSSISTPLSYETSNHPFSRMDPSPVSTPPPPPHPPGSHSTQLTIAMSQKHASEVLALHSKEKARSKSATTESAVDDKTLLSRFAPTYTPLWLKQVNTCYPSLVIPLSASPDSSNSQYSLIAEIYPPKLLKQLLALEQSTTSRIKTQLSSTLPKLSQSLLTAPEPKSVSLHPLSPATYAAHFLPLHLLEYSARSLELYKSSLYNVPLKPYTATSLSSSSNLNLFALPTPFIRESWPPIAMGDTCFIRPLVENDKWWKGVEVEARVWAIDRIRGEVILNVEEKAVEWLTANGSEASKLEVEENGAEGEEEERGFVSVNLIWKIQGERTFVFLAISSETSFTILTTNMCDQLRLCSRSSVRRLEESDRDHRFAPKSIAHLVRAELSTCLSTSLSSCSIDLEQLYNDEDSSETISGRELALSDAGGSGERRDRRSSYGIVPR